MSPQQSSRTRPQGRRTTRPAEFKQAKPLIARSEQQFDRMIWLRVAREYFSPYACRQ